jgi:hypothetical protein
MSIRVRAVIWVYAAYHAAKTHRIAPAFVSKLCPTLIRADVRQIVRAERRRRPTWNF